MPDRSVPTRQPSVRPPVPSSLGYLPGLDGLRAISVTAVLLYHADLTWIPGGFLGVEVFFVISGYLITLLLLTEYDRAGRLSFGSFYARRARRLLPALYALVTATVVVAAVGYRHELDKLKGQVAAAFGYCTNWYSIVTNQSYFAAAGRPPLLRHLWSLAVEEQFYLLWPVLLFGLVSLLRNRRPAMATVITLAAAASALEMAVLFKPAVDPSRVYYGTDTRASGLLLGAALAVLWRPRELTPRSARMVDAGALVAVVGLGACFLTIHEYDRFLYRGGFVVVSLLTLVVIAGVVHPSASASRAVLGHPALAWIGLRSYSLYLWHWPVFAITRPGVDWGLSTGPALAARLGITVALAELSYRFVEMPIRNGALGRLWAALRAGPAEPAQRLVRRQVAVTAAFAAAAVLVPATATLVSARHAAAGSETAGLAGGDPTGDTAPETSAPTLAVPGTEATPGTLGTGGGATTSAAPGAAKGRVTVLTDSVLLRIRPDMTAALQGAGWKVDYRGKSALMLDKAREMLEKDGSPVGDVVVIGLGYNSLWEHDRSHYDAWAEKFDQQADDLLATLTKLGAKRFVWVTLREPSPDVIPKQSGAEYKQYAWFFPYANERIRLIPGRHPNVVLADWTAISNVPGITGDLIHLNAKGTRMMIDLVLSAGAF